MDIINYNELSKYNLSYINSNIYNNKSTIKCYLNNLNKNTNIFLKTPKCELGSNINSGFIVISIINNDKNNIFINFIKKIEKETGLYIKNKLKKKNIKLYSNFINDNKKKDNINIKYIFKILKNHNTFNIFDHNGNILDNNKLEMYSNIILLIKLQNIWIDFEKNLYGLNWRIYQIKIYPDINLNKCLIFDSEDENDTDANISKTEIIVQKCVFCNSICSFNNNINNINIAKGKGKGKGKSIISNNINTTSSGRGKNITKKIESEKPKTTNIIMPPTVNELINMKNKLKKVVKNLSDSD